METNAGIPKLFCLLLTIITSWLVLTACQEDSLLPSGVEVATETAVPTETPTPPTQPPFRVVAYVTGAIIPELIPYERLTHINYAFLIPDADGSFAPFANGWKLKKIAAEADRANVKLLISVGGWGWDEQFEIMAADPALRANFVQNLSAFIAEYDLDGADIDWEYPDPGQSGQNFLALIGELRLAMPDKLLTTAVIAHGQTGDGIPGETFELFDFINLMTYAGSDHGTMAQFNAGLDYWQGRGLPPEKTVMGVPFYAQPGEVIYRKIVEADPQAADVDSIEWNGATIFYNGIPTIQTKTRLAMQQAGGIMFWTLDQDALDDLSLLRAIDEVVRQQK